MNKPSNQSSNQLSGAPHRIGLYPGTFHPMTYGHYDVLKRALILVDELVIGVAVNAGKGPLFTLEERVAMVETEVADLTADIGVKVSVRPFETLLVQFADEVNADVIIRGLRAVSDFEYEYQMVAMNDALNDRIDTVFLMADLKYQAIASRLVKEIARLDGDISAFVPERIADKLLKKLKK